MNDNHDNSSPSPKTAILDELESIKGLLDDSFDDDDDLSIDIPILEDVVNQADDNATSLLDLDQIFDEDTPLDDTSTSVAEPAEIHSLDKNTEQESLLDELGESGEPTEIDNEFLEEEFTSLELDNVAFDDLGTDIAIPSFTLATETDGIASTTSIPNTISEMDASNDIASDDDEVESEPVQQGLLGTEQSSTLEKEQDDLFADDAAESSLAIETANASTLDNDEEPDLQFLIQDIVDEMIPQIEDELRRRLSTYSATAIKQLAGKHVGS